MNHNQISPLEIFVGRLLAACLHPWLAWRVSSPAGRLLVVAAYFTAAFVTLLGTLLFLAPAGSF